MWSAIMMLVAMALATFMAVRRGVIVFPLVVAWALVGIASRYPTTPVLTLPAWTLSTAGALIVLASFRRRTPLADP